MMTATKMFLKSVFIVTVSILLSNCRATSKEEWSVKLDQLAADFTQGYNDRDVEGIDALMAVDVHRLPPGEHVQINLTGLNWTDLVQGKYQMILNNVRWFCDDNAVMEYRNIIELPDKTMSSKGIAFVTVDNGQPKVETAVWNFNA